MLNELKAFARVARSNISRLPSPYMATFALTYRCNLRCSVCSIWKRPVKEELSSTEIRAFFKRSNKFSWLLFTGGEIFLRPDIAEIIGGAAAECRQLCAISFPTNGYDTGAIVKAVSEIAAYDIPRLFVTVSLDGPAEVHDRIKGVDGSWERAMETYRKLKEIRKAGVFLSMTLSGHNAGAVDKTLSAIKRAHASFDEKKDLSFNIFNTSEHYYGNGGAERPDAGLLRGGVKRASELVAGRSAKGFLHYNYYKYAQDYLNGARHPLPCSALSAGCFIDPYGGVYPCNAYNRPLGNIREFGFDIQELWGRRYTAEVFKECRNGDCPGCWSPCEAFPTIGGNLAPAIMNYFGIG